MYLYLINFRMATNYNVLENIMDARKKFRGCAILYMRDMADLMNATTFNGTKIDKATRVEIILTSLAEEYANFVTYFLGFGKDYKMALLQSKLFAWRDGLIEHVYHQFHLRVATPSRQPSQEDLPLENVLALGEPSVIVILDDDDLNPESCGGNVPFTNLHVLKAFYAGDLLSSRIIDSGLLIIFVQPYMCLTRGRN